MRKSLKNTSHGHIIAKDQISAKSKPIKRLTKQISSPSKITTGSSKMDNMSTQSEQSFYNPIKQPNFSEKHMANFIKKDIEKSDMRYEEIKGLISKKV